MKRTPFDTLSLAFVLLLGLEAAGQSAEPPKPDPRPNILLAIADDWAWPHAGVYDDRVVKTPTFDRLARDGVLFNHAYVAGNPQYAPRSGSFTALDRWMQQTGDPRARGETEFWDTCPYVARPAGRRSGDRRVGQPPSAVPVDWQAVALRR